MASSNTAVRNQRVVIIGAGSGGLSAAKRLARSPCRINLIDRHNYRLFQPLLYPLPVQIPELS
jgi:NADH:ubiquinone reductase (H+-translocating)